MQDKEEEEKQPEQVLKLNFISVDLDVILRRMPDGHKLSG